MQLRPYQQELIDKIREKFVDGKTHILVSAPTGAGKTIISKSIVESTVSKGKRVLFTAHRRKLIEQTYNVFGKNSSVVMGNDKRFNEDSLIQIATLQSLRTRKLTTPDLIIFDEVHYAPKMINTIKKRFPKAYTIGLSATPIDSQGYLLEGWDEIIQDIDINYLIKNGYLVDTENYAPMRLNLEDVKMQCGDYSNTELDKKLNKDYECSNIIENWIKYGGGKKTVVFCINIKHSENVCKSFLKAGIKCGVIHSKKTDEELEETYKQFYNDEIKVLCNVDVLTTGWDCPDLECILFARPTKSLRLYLQMVGRGLRQSINKEKCLILDCANVIFDNGIPTEHRVFKRKPFISERVDKLVGISRDNPKTRLTEEREVYLLKIQKYLDLYANKKYRNESELQTDVNKYLKKTGYFWWRQNSGKVLHQKRWISFTNKAGLPDITFMYKKSSVYVGIELKMPYGRLTPKQNVTFREMIDQGVLLFFASNVMDIFLIIEFLEKNIIESDAGYFINKNIYNLFERQDSFYLKFMLKKRSV